MRRIAVLALVAAALGVGAPSTHAAEPASAACDVGTVVQTIVDGGPNTFTGVAYGYVAADASVDGPVAVTIRCSVRVDGAEVAATGTGSGTVLATAQGEVTYTASETQDVDVCAEWTVGSSSGATCGDAMAPQIPPQDVIDALNSILDLLADSGPGPALDWVLCGALQALGAPALVNLLAPAASMDADDCDLYHEGERWIDFAPYED